MKDKETATLAGGCFWCTEAIFKRVKGVESVTPGYSGSEHTECLQIKFDPKTVTYLKLLEIFFKTHDPASYDKQGADTGPQYRSIVFYQNNSQKEEVEKLIKKFDEEKVFNGKIVTEVKPFTNFYEAESYHKNFYEKNKDNPYCTIVINPKLEKLYKEFGSEDVLQSNYE